MNYLIVQLMDDAVVFARFQRRRGATTFLDGGRADREPAKPFGELLAETLPAATEPEKVILAISPRLVSLRELDLHLADRRKAREVLPVELKGETVVESNDLVFDALTLADGRTLALWCRRETIAGLIRDLAAVGREPEVVTAVPFQWHRLVPAADRGLTVAVTDGEALAVFAEGSLAFCRALSADDPAKDASRTLAALELGREVRIDRILVLGSSDLARSVAVPAGCTVVPAAAEGELGEVFSDNEAARDLASAFAVLEAVTVGSAVNFRSGSLAYTAGQVLLRRRLRLSFALAVAVVLLLFAETGVRYFLVHRDVTSLNASIGTIYHQVFPNRKKAVDEVDELRSEIKLLSTGGSGSEVLATLNRIAGIKEEGISLYEADIDKDQVQLRGDARSIETVNGFRDKAATFFKDAEVAEIKSKPDGGVSFLFRGTAKEVTP